MNWCRVIGLVCAVMHVPLADVAAMTLGQLMRYYRELPEIVKITSPFGGGDDSSAPGSSSPGRVVTDPKNIRAIAGMFPLERKVVPGG